MRNDAMFVSASEFNIFTQQLMQVIINLNKPVLCKLRNGTYLPVSFTEKSTTEESFFHTENYTHAWNLDGSSLKNRDLDIVEFGSE